MNICKEKPDNLPPLDVIGLEASDTSHTMSRGGSGRNRTPSGMPPPVNARSASIGLGIGMASGMGKSAGIGFQMGQFSTSAGKMSSEERFMAATTGRSASVSGVPLGGRPPAMVRTISQGGIAGRDRTRSKRGANDSNRTSVASNPGPTSLMSNMGPPMEHVAPLEVSTNRWVAGSTRRGGSGLDGDSPEVVERKVKGLLNKLTMERFDSISDQIIAWANKSEKEKDGRTLIQVIKLVFEKATDEATFSEMYARLCRKMMEQISPKVQDDGIKNSEGKPFAGGNLFRKYLLNRCQEDFERGWVAKEATAAAAASKATADLAVKEANEKTKGGEDSELYSDEYYAAAKAKRRGLGLIRFIGELFKLQMLTERIMHECIKKLLGNVENPEEEEIESLCKLLTTVGSLLDTPKARAHLDVYFSRMRELTKNKNVNARMVFMLQDVIELRERKWIPRNTVSAPSTIAQVHEAAAKEKQAQEKDAMMRQNASMSRGGSRRGGNRDAAEPPHPDGWSVAGQGAARPPPKAGDLSHFGKINKVTVPVSFGPSSVFSLKKGSDPKSRDSPLSRTASSSNMFSMLQSSDAIAEPPTSKGSRPPSRKPSVDLGVGAAPEPAPQRRKLQLLPRTRPVGEESKASTPAVSEAGSDDDAVEDGDALAPASISEDEAKSKIDEDVKEFFGIRLLDEAESYFSSLPTEHRHHLVDTLVMKSIEMKEPDVKLVGDLFIRVREKELCSPAIFEEGFNALAELLDDLAVDIPKAWQYFAILLKGSGLDQDEERYTRIAEKTMDADRLNQQLL
ncbi:armadillo-type protein [Lactarius quietus]|nr:armadillo-type protein [Lactarius quietus]